MAYLVQGIIKRMKFYVELKLSGLLFCLLIAQTSISAQVSDFQVNNIQGVVAHSDWNMPEVSTAVNDSGNFLVAWTDWRDGYYYDIFAQRYSADGIALGGNFKVNDSINPVSIGFFISGIPCVSANANGDFVITWMRWSLYDEYKYGPDIYARCYSNNGTPLGSNFKVNNLPEDLHRCGFPSVSVGNTGNFVVTWTTATDNIYAQRYANDGSPIGSNFKVNSIEGYNLDKPSVAMDQNDNFIITWTTYVGEEHGYDDNYIIIYAQRYSSDGEPVGNNFMVNDKPGLLWGSYSGTTPTTIAMDSSGNFVIAWAGNRGGCESWRADIYAQRFANNGVALGNNIKVDDDVDCAQYFSSVSMDNDGNFVITWNEYRNSNSDIYAQCFTRDGNKLGDNFLVTNTSDSTQYGPSVKLWNGKIYTAWVDNRNDARGFDVWANIIERDFPDVEVSNVNVLIPSEFKLSQNHPNPFKSTTTISYMIPLPSDVDLSIYNMMGQRLSTLAKGMHNTGIHEVEWYANDIEGGIYIYRLLINEKIIQSRKLILLK